jgi:proteic killer suppression protein
MQPLDQFFSMLDAATRPGDMDLPGFAFHPLKGDLKGHYAVKVSGNWRITFRFGKEPEDVNLTDYH